MRLAPVYMNAEAENIIAQLGLEPLPEEGGFYRQVWVSAARLANGRPAASCIWFLLTPEGFSAWHRVDAEEVWQFRAGDPVTQVQLDPDTGTARESVLADGLTPPLVVPAGGWQAAQLAAGPRSRGWALLTCTMTPAWDAAGFELGQRRSLGQEFPVAADWIAALTR